MTKNIEIPIDRLVFGFGLIFVLGILFAVVNGYYIEESGDSLPFIVYGISLVSIFIGGILILLFKWKINKVQLQKILLILQKEEAEVISILIENNFKLEQNKLVALTGFKKVKMSRILSKFEQRGILEKRHLGNTNLIILTLKK